MKEVKNLAKPGKKREIKREKRIRERENKTIKPL